MEAGHAVDDAVSQTVEGVALHGERADVVPCVDCQKHAQPHLMQFGTLC